MQWEACNPIGWPSAAILASRSHQIRDCVSMWRRPPLAMGPPRLL